MTEDGALEPDRTRDGAGRTLRIVTWNCHGSVGRDLRCRPERILAAIERLRPDILALQEVDGRSHLGRRERAFEWFAERLGPHVAEARTLRRTDRDYGHLLWSRWPLRSAGTLRLPGRGIEPRMAIEALVDAPSGPVTVLAAHLGLSPFARSAQAAFLAERAAASPHPVVVLGDTNAWRLSGPVDDALRRALPVRIAAKSFPAWWPLVPMDRIYLDEDFEVVERFVDAPASRSSDHLPLVADVRIVA